MVGYLIKFFSLFKINILGAGIIYFVLYLPYTILANYGTQALAYQKVIAVRIKNFKERFEFEFLFSFFVVFIIDGCIWTWL